MIPTIKMMQEMEESELVAKDLLRQGSEAEHVEDLCNRIIKLVEFNTELRKLLTEQYRINRVLRGDS